MDSNSIIFKSFYFPLHFARFFLKKRNHEYYYRISDISPENYNFELQIMGSRAHFWNEPFEVVNNPLIIFNCAPMDLITIGSLHAKCMSKINHNYKLKYKILNKFNKSGTLENPTNKKYSLFFDEKNTIFNEDSINKKIVKMLIRHTNKFFEMTFEEFIEKPELLKETYPPDLIKIGFLYN